MSLDLFTDEEVKKLAKDNGWSITCPLGLQPFKTLLNAAVESKLKLVAYTNDSWLNAADGYFTTRLANGFPIKLYRLNTTKE